jgi:hypothetical protein
MKQARARSPGSCYTRNIMHIFYCVVLLDAGFIDREPEHAHNGLLSVSSIKLCPTRNCILPYEMIVLELFLHYFSSIVICESHLFFLNLDILLLALIGLGGGKCSSDGSPEIVGIYYEGLLSKYNARVIKLAIKCCSLKFAFSQRKVGVITKNSVPDTFNLERSNLVSL